jgi:protein O-GlcNAc transferase
MHICVYMYIIQGHTRGGRPEILMRRIAPVQVAYLIYPGTSGAPWLDYVIVDKVVTPPDYSFMTISSSSSVEEQEEASGRSSSMTTTKERRSSIYSEHLVYLPNCYQINYYERHLNSQSINDRNMKWEEKENPVNPEILTNSSGFVFANFNKIDKIEPMIFGVWMNILRRVPHSILWLLKPSKKVASLIMSNLYEEAKSRGIDHNRILFAPRVDKVCVCCCCCVSKLAPTYPTCDTHSPPLTTIF